MSATVLLVWSVADDSKLSDRQTRRKSANCQPAVNDNAEVACRADNANSWRQDLDFADSDSVKVMSWTDPREG